MATDYWPDQDGRIFDCLTVSAYAESTSITANYAVMMGTSTSGILKVTVPSSSNLGEGFGIALKTPVAVGDYIPVMLLGICKTIVAGFGAAASVQKVMVGSLVINSGVTGIIGVGDANSGVFLTPLWKGSSCILGKALQSGVSASDEVLIFVGKCF